VRSTRRRQWSRSPDLLVAYCVRCARSVLQRGPAEACCGVTSDVPTICRGGDIFIRSAPLGGAPDPAARGAQRALGPAGAG
jgi:hypothetical protein